MRFVITLLALLLLGANEPSAVVEIRSQPFAEVLWEGVPLAKTDREGVLIIEDVPAGDYQLALQADGFARRDLRVTVAPGERRVVDLPLTSSGASPAAEAGTHGTPAAAGRADGGHSPSSLGFWIAGLAVALVLATAFFVAPRKALGRSEAIPEAPPPVDRSASPLVEAELSELEQGSPAFLEDLKLREQKLENLDTPRQPPPEDLIIEVEATEVRRVDLFGREKP
ncbi:MAG: carboxypeptidase-like regulatory domain-containing protein [Acidobacteriota bacterium]